MVATAELQPDEIQNLADQISDMQKAAVGLELRVRVEIELDAKREPTNDVLKRLNEILNQVSANLKLRS